MHRYAPARLGAVATDPQRMTLSEASKATGKSIDSLRRALKRANNPLEATLDETGAYRVSVNALEVAGFSIAAPETPPADVARLEADLAAARAELDALRAARLDDRALLEATLEALRATTRALEAGSGPATESQPTREQVPTRRKWWRK